MHCNQKLTLEVLKNSVFDLDLPAFKKVNRSHKRDSRTFNLETNWFLHLGIRRVSISSKVLWLGLMAIRAQSGGAIRDIDCKTLQQLIPLRGHSVSKLLINLSKFELVTIELKGTKQAVKCR